MVMPENWRTVRISLSNITPRATLTTGSRVLSIVALEEPVSRIPVKKSRFDKKVEKKALASTAAQAFGVTDTRKLPVIRAAAISVKVAAVVLQHLLSFVDSLF